MGTKSIEYCKKFRITNTKTGASYEGKWADIIQEAGLKPGYNAVSMRKAKKWKVELIEESQEWDQQSYRAELYAKTKHRYPEYEKRKAEIEPRFEQRKRLFRLKHLNPDGSRYTIEQYKEDILVPCEVCRKTTNLVVDHCHSTNIVRGTLCRSCNLALGFVEDNTQILYNLISYIEDRKNGKTRNI